ncbi:MAG: hypothetical protein MUC56_15730 [Thermoanaerobaculales bacterium]|jgi:hypothetical protein|nr:hypothetical protein [Thermoanaerobaculales bacterium]
MQGDTGYAVIVVSHDHAETLAACLDAVAGLDPAPAEVVVAKHPGSVSRWLETSRCVADRRRVQALIEDLCDRLSRICELGSNTAWL